jgi:hypothetical protein
MAKLDLSERTEALQELVELTEELSAHLESLSCAASDQELCARVQEATTLALSDCQRETAERARSLRSRLSKLKDHPKLHDPRFSSCQLQEALEDAVAQLGPLAQVASDLAGMTAWLDALHLTKKAQLSLRQSDAIARELEAGIEALKEAEKAPIPGTDARFVQRGMRQHGDDVVIWLEMRAKSGGCGAAWLFALDQDGDVLNSAMRRAPWSQWDILEFRAPAVQAEDIAALRIQFS